jgi:bacterioferritin (cytochrome b1)
MTPPDTTHNLNRVLAVLCKSFPQYVKFSRPYIPRSRQEVLDTIEQIASDQTMLAERISQQVSEAGGLPQLGNFPMEFTDTHDLNINHLLREAIRYQREEITTLAACRDELSQSPTARALVEEAVGMAKGHLESLEELPSNGGASKQPAIVA